MNTTDKKDTFTKFQEFSMVNWWVTWIAILLSAGYNIATVEYLRSEFGNALEIMQKESEGIVMLDSLGRPSLIGKTNLNITSEEFKKSIVNNVQNYLVWDWVSLTNNFENKVLDVDGLEKFNPKLVDFKNNFIADESAYKDLLFFEKYLVSLAVGDNIPEMLSMTSYKVSNYQARGNSFSSKIDFVFTANLYNINSGKYESRLANMSFTLEGLFDSGNGNILNPLGLKYTKIEAVLPTKR